MLEARLKIKCFIFFEKEMFIFYDNGSYSSNDEEHHNNINISKAQQVTTTISRHY